MKIPAFDTQNADFRKRWQAFLQNPGRLEEVAAQAKAIIEEVRKKGDAALLRLTRDLDGFPASGMESLVVDQDACRDAWASLSPDMQEALALASERIASFHRREAQALSSWRMQDEYGNVLGQEIRPLERVGIYAPGGRAAYPSSVLMNAIAAQVAGVEEIYVATPAPQGAPRSEVLAACHLAGVKRVFLLGGAQAIAALALGTATVPRVDKITGPGNAWVVAAKKLLFGEVGLDAPAGPSEVAVVADGSSSPAWAAWDLLAQAEHDPEARVFLLSPDARWMSSVQKHLEEALPSLPRREIIGASLENSALARTQDVEEALALANDIAPEHLVLALAEAEKWLSSVRHAGAVFLGAASVQALGDYLAGPNHVLPTAGAARFASALSVMDFVKRLSVVSLSQAGAWALSPQGALLARAEGLEAHARAMEARLQDLP